MGRKLGLGVLWLWRGFAGLTGVWILAAVTGVCAVSAPFDHLYNMGRTPYLPDCRAPDDGRRHLVVLQHGLLRSSASLARLERMLWRHGYEVCNESYPSSAAFVEDHARRLDGHVRRCLDRVDDPRPVALYCVGHSMGGLVLEQWLANTSDLVPEACVFMGTPHRGAALADARRDVAFFRVFAGQKAASQLLSDDPFHDREICNLGDVGVVVGRSGDGRGRSRTVPGDDDRTVAVVEALLPVDVGPCVDFRGVLWTHAHHTAMTVETEVLTGILRFLANRSFEE